jgi:homogentisate 1,2-dioxygenase
MKRWISFPRTEGLATRQAHCDLPANTYEREMGKEGFSGPAAHFVHAHRPTDWIAFEGALQPHAWDLNRLPADAAMPHDAPVVAANGDTVMRGWRCTRAMTELARNQDGDELMFVHAGSGELHCDWGHLSYREGDYVVMPRGGMWRIEPAEPTWMLLIEATESSWQLPDKGLVGAHAIFDAAALDTPRMDDAFRAQQQGEAGARAWTVRVKRLGATSTITYPFNPLDALGWHGDLAPVRINWRDLRPLMSHRYHLPPSAHSTFVARNAVVCTFVPRPIESDPGALKVPFFHNNDDYDELIFYHRGQFFSRDAIRPGMVTFHPCGFTHGPHPKAFEAGASFARKETDEVAVMLDTRFPLQPGSATQAVAVADYAASWRRPAGAT